MPRNLVKRADIKQFLNIYVFFRFVLFSSVLGQVSILTKETHVSQ